MLPSTPERYATYVTNLIDSATPKKQIALSQKKIVSGQKKRDASATIISGVKDLYSKTKTCSRKSLDIRNAVDSTILKQLRSKSLVRSAARLLKMERRNLRVKPRAISMKVSNMQEDTK